MKPVKKSISITLDYPVYERVKELAEYEDRSTSSYINLVLREHLRRVKQGAGIEQSGGPTERKDALDAAKEGKDE